MLTHLANFHAGWLMILAAFLSGGLIGLGFHRESFLGGYTSFRRRVLRLGHIALAALGMINVLYALSPLPLPGSWNAAPAGVLWIAGGIAMPAACFLTAWRARFRHLFVLPVGALLGAVILTLLN